MQKSDEDISPPNSAPSSPVDEQLREEETLADEDAGAAEFNRDAAFELDDEEA
eukprot:SAG11_NODE_18261_length_496_cov_0.420655_1_plen_52_part_10